MLRHGDKYCVKCGKYLGNYMTDDYYKLLKQKYCTACAKLVKADKTAESLRRIRRQKREKFDLLEEQNRLLKEENKLLRERIAELRGDEHGQKQTD